MVKTSVRGAALPGCYRQGTEVNGNRNQRISLSTMEPGKVRLGWKFCFRSVGNFGKSIEWLLTE